MANLFSEASEQGVGNREPGLPKKDDRDSMPHLFPSVHTISSMQAATFSLASRTPPSIKISLQEPTIPHPNSHSNPAPTPPPPQSNHISLRTTPQPRSSTRSLATQRASGYGVYCEIMTGEQASSQRWELAVDGYGIGRGLG